MAVRFLGRAIISLNQRCFPQVFAVSLAESKYLTEFGSTQYRCFHKSMPRLDLTNIEYEKLSKETLEKLCDCFEEILEDIDDADVNLSDGVLTAKLGNTRGTYVINKQTPNKQIWLSSPISGPKRYDFIDGKWTYKHENSELNSLLTQELRQLLDNDKIQFDDK